MKKSRVVFFVRSFNDIDHITPLIHYCGLNQSLQAEVYCLDWKYPLFENPNIQFLMKSGVIQIGYLWGPHCASFFTGLLCRIVDIVRRCESLIKHKQGQNRFTRAVFGRIRRGLVFIVTNIYDLLPIKKVFEEEVPKALIFDYLNAGAPRNRKIVARANELKIPTFCLPHGIVIYSNKYITSSRNLVVDSSGLYFDYYIGGGLMRDYLKWRGIPEERIREIGSLRFCPEWREIRQRSVFPRKAENTSAQREPDRLKVVFFLHQLVYNANPSMLEASIRCLGEIEGISVRLKPHTRGMDLSDISRLVKSANNLELAVGTESADLIDWCDVAMSTGSSVIIDAVLAGKIFVYPDFVDTNRVFFKDEDACWTVSSIEALRTALNSLVKNKTKVPYSRLAQEKLLSRLVFAGGFSKDVREHHLRFILSAEKISC